MDSLWDMLIIKLFLWGINSQKTDQKSWNTRPLELIPIVDEKTEWNRHSEKQFGSFTEN